MSKPSKHDLAARLARGDEAAFAELYDACADRLHDYLTLRLGSSDSAADVLQNTFLRAVKSRRRFRGVENPVAYLFQIARNEAMRHAGRHRAREVPLPMEFVGGDICQWSENAEAVRAALSRLNTEDRELVELKAYAGLTFREIADMTGLPLGTVATRYRRALESLRGWLTKQFR